MNESNVSLILGVQNNNFEMVFHVLNVLVFRKSTASAIRECIDNIANKIRWQGRSVFIC